jgi:membrane protein YqaA with SNARE-associated domain
MEQTGKSERLNGFIEAAKSKGASDEFLVNLLREEGWAAKEIYAAFRRHYESLTGLALPARGEGAGESARDAFLYLLAFFTLATWATALGSLLFTFIDRWFPDPLVARNYFENSRYAVSSEMACIIVAFPIFLLVMRFILREVDKHPEKVESGVRKWLTYIALLVTAGIVIGDLITFLAFFLRGELTSRFVLKALAVIVIAGSIFWYYLGFLKRGAADAEA